MAKKTNGKTIQRIKKGSRRLTISIPPNLWVLVSEQYEKGNYGTYSEVIFEILREYYHIEK